MNSKRMLAVAALLLAAAAPTRAQTVTTGTFTVPGGSTSLLIAETVENNWKLGALFDCNVVGNELEVTGTAAPCNGQKRLYLFEPQTMDGMTSSDITFEFELTCSSPAEDTVSAKLELDGLGLVALPVGSTTVTAGNGDMIKVTTSTSGGGGPVGGFAWMLALAALVVVGGALQLRRRASPAREPAG